MLLNAFDNSHVLNILKLYHLNFILRIKQTQMHEVITTNDFIVVHQTSSA